MKLCFASILITSLAGAAAAQTDERWGCQADLRMTGPTGGEHLGTIGDSGGDWDGDGKQDLVVGGGADAVTGVTDIYLFLGRGCPADPCNTTPFDLDPALVFDDLATKSSATGALWANCAFVGDIDGGGQDDIALAEPFWSKDTTLRQVGRVFLFFAENHDTLTPGTVLTPATDADVIIEGAIPYAWFGYALDGLDVSPGVAGGDLLVGAPGNQATVPTFSGKAYVVEGASILAATSPVSVSSLTSVEYSGASGDRFGYSVARIGNLNQDSKEEFIVGAPQVDILTGFVNPSSTCSGCTGYAEVFGYPSTTALRHLSASAPSGGSLKGFGLSVTGLKSVNSGSIPDIAVGAPWYSPFDTSLNAAIIIGAVYEYDGRTGTLLHGPITPQDGSGQPDEAYKGAALGYDLDGLDDFDGDGKGDILAGAPLYIEPHGSTPCGDLPGVNGDMLGCVLVYSGADGATILARYRGEVGGGKPRLGFSVAAGGIDGDGVSDVYSGQLGWSEEPVADEEGRAFVFFGNPCCPP